MEKTNIKVGDKLYLRQFTGDSFVDMVKRPYTVVKVTKGRVKVQSCKFIWPEYHCCGDPYTDCPDLEGKRVQFYNSLPEIIEEDLNGELVDLTWHSKKGMWGTKGRDREYPEYAIFGKWEYMPYLN